MYELLMCILCILYIQGKHLRKWFILGPKLCDFKEFSEMHMSWDDINWEREKLYRTEIINAWVMWIGIIWVAINPNVTSDQGW